ncbi:MAG: T9SS type A sorting domain-containing protein [Niastella sp.]|nr:T9SS type A sorting domain-containing protein [Niastella sp.]
MKRVLLLLLLITGFATTHAQWSNTTNQFYDSLDMPVVQMANDQKNPLVVKSEPDGGYVVIWEDNRAGNTDIYAQKYDKNGHRLWAENGIPVATGTDHQLYSTIANTQSSTYSYRNVGHAATDAAGGFYIAFTTTNHNDVYVQHIKNDGSRAFVNEGYPIAVHTTAIQPYYSHPQLIADGRGGFFIGYYVKNPYNDVYVYCYKDEGGSLRRYGGGIMNQYATQETSDAYCGKRYSINYNNSGTAKSFVIFSDLQDGCGVIMAEAITGEKVFPAFNRLARVKKDSRVTKDIWGQLPSAIINPDGTSAPVIPERHEYFYKKDSVIRTYSYSSRFENVSCNIILNYPVPPGQEPDIRLVEYVNYYVTSNGFAALKGPVYDVDRVLATVLPTDGNIDAMIVTWNERNYINNKITEFVTRGYSLPLEKYDSVPYHLATDTLYPNFVYNPIAPAGLNKLNQAPGEIDTLIASPRVNYFYDFAFTGSGNRAFLATAPLPVLGTQSYDSIFYQEIKLSRVAADAFEVKRNTGQPHGVLIGTGQSTSNSVYNPTPGIAGDGAGNAVFYYGKSQSTIQASPIGDRGKFWWGAFGTPLNTGRWDRSWTSPSTPSIHMNTDGTGVAVWFDGRKTPDGYTGYNIYMRHLDSLLNPAYQPPAHTLRPIRPGVSASTIADPQVMAGSSQAWTGFRGLTYDGYYYTPLVSVKDDYPLGTVTASAFDYVGPVRTTTAGKPYLDRNYTISVTNHPANAAIHVRLIFTKAQFDALKAKEPSIQDPGNLMVVKQPSTGTAPATYTISANDQNIQPVGWGTIENTVSNQTVIEGYYIEVVIDDFSNFFIMRAESTLPVTLQSFTVKAVGNNALLQWVTASEFNNDHFDIERSADGRAFTKIGRLQGNGTTSIPQDYRFTDAAPLTGNNYYRLAQVDLDGNINYSPIRLLSFNAQVRTMQLSPNPAKSTLHILLPQAASGQHNIELYNLSGMKVLVQSVPAGTMQLDADISTLAPGMYIVRYGDKNMKVVKQ